MNLTDFLLARIAEDDVLTSPRRWQVWLRPYVFRAFPEFVKRNMAAKHRDHPDYDESWRP